MDRVAAAQQALNAGKTAEAVDHLIAAVEENPARPSQLYFTLGHQLYLLNRHDEAVSWVELGLARHPKAFGLLNLRGVLLRRQGRFGEAATALRQALKLEPKNQSAMTNLANVLLDAEEPKAAEAILEKLVRLAPRHAEHRRMLGRALLRQHRTDEAQARFRQAILLDKNLKNAWLDLFNLLAETGQQDEAEKLLDQSEAQFPQDPQFVEARAVLLRRRGRRDEAAAYVEAVLEKNPDLAWAHKQLGLHYADSDRPRADRHLQRAFELEPDNLNYRFLYAENLNRKRFGDEAANIEAGYALLRDVPNLAAQPILHKKIALDLFTRVADYDRLKQLGTFSELANGFAAGGLHTAFLGMLGRVETDEDRTALLKAHRNWGRGVEAKVEPARVAPRRARGPRSKIRLGLMSSDLRRHPVGYFALPLVDHLDRDRFEVFVYAFYERGQDPLMGYIAENVTAYNNWPGVPSEEVAGRIAEDGIDLLLELGGTTHMNRLDVMAWRPAPKQGSWLGYPHSAGLESLDYLVCDPYCAPPRRELLLEAPLMMPKTWIALGRMVFGDEHVIEDGLPQDREGVITFGTANNPHKYNPKTFDYWTSVMRAVPGSRFAFVRPEGEGAGFRTNIQAQFAKGGISADRIDFHTVRGAHMPFYNRIDISLDTLPLTGGTTTTEALWMGVPVVSLVGDAFYERLSYSILNNAGLGDLCAEDKDGYVQKAVALAEDRSRLADLRRSLRDQLREGPLGRTEDFARDFYDMIARELGAPAA